MATNPILSSFSLSHAGILSGTSAAEDADLFGVNEGSLELESDSYDRTGDDKILSTTRWITKGTLSLKTNYIPLDMMALLYGTEVAQDAESGGVSMQLWTENAMNIRPRPVVVRAPGEDSDGNPYTIEIVLYKVKFGQMSFDQFMSYKEGLGLSFDADALLSDKDELGNEFTDGQGARIGKLIGKPKPVSIGG